MTWTWDDETTPTEDVASSVEPDGPPGDAPPPFLPTPPAACHLQEFQAEAVGVVVSDIAEPVAKKVDPFDRLKELEAEVLEDSLKVVSAALAFPDAIGEDGSLVEAPPEEWVEQYGEDGARRRFVIARAAAMSGREAPVGLKLAQQMAVGSMAALERAKVGSVTFNMQFVKMVAPPVFEELEVVEEK